MKHIYEVDANAWREGMPSPELIAASEPEELPVWAVCINAADTNDDGSPIVFWNVASPPMIAAGVAVRVVVYEQGVE
jgi:hypothetical protein